MAKLLNRTSLAKTIDNVNEAFFYGRKITKKEAAEIIKWVCSRLDTMYSYSGSFGLTPQDMKDKVYTFTGERLQSASMRHIIAEESSRILKQLSRITGKKIPELEISNKKLLEGIMRSEAEGRPRGTYCCGPCTAGLWRNLAVGGLGSYSKKLPKGTEILKSYRDGKGGWRRFPFYYTLLALSEVKRPAAKNEINYAMPQIERKLKSTRSNGKFPERRRELMLKLISS